jgi:hypothetical protein
MNASNEHAQLFRTEREVFRQFKQAFSATIRVVAVVAKHCSRESWWTLSSVRAVVMMLVNGCEPLIFAFWYTEPANALGPPELLELRAFARGTAPIVR